MGVSENRGTSKSSHFNRFSIINHPFWGTPIFGNTHIIVQIPILQLLRLFKSVGLVDTFDITDCLSLGRSTPRSTTRKMPRQKGEQHGSNWMWSFFGVTHPLVNFQHGLTPIIPRVFLGGRSHFWGKPPFLGHPRVWCGWTPVGGGFTAGKGTVGDPVNAKSRRFSNCSMAFATRAAQDFISKNSRASYAASALAPHGMPGSW